MRAIEKTGGVFMQTKEVFEDKTVTAADFSSELCALAREHLVGLIKTAGESGFIFSLPGEVKTFRVCVTEEKGE